MRKAFWMGYVIAAGLTFCLGATPTLARETHSEVSEVERIPALKAQYPTPSDPNQLFFIQRTLNANTVVYAANIDTAGKLDPKEPVKAYWRRYNRDGHIKPLSMPERVMAYGIKSITHDGPSGAIAVTIAALPQRKIVLAPDAKGRFEALGKVANRWIRIVAIYLDVDDSGLMPNVRTIDLYGYDKTSGKPVREHIVPR